GIPGNSATWRPLKRRERPARPYPPPPGRRAPLPPQHRQLQPLLLRAVDGDVIAGIGVAHDAGAGVVPQHALDAAVGGLAAVAHDHHAGVLRVAHAHAAAVVQADPGRAAGDVEHGIEQRPVADGVAAVAHGLGLAVGAGDAAAAQVVAADA